jgi:hypothetical protein
MSWIVNGTGLTSALVMLSAVSNCSPALALPPQGAWKDHTLYQLNGLGPPRKLPARLKTLSENWSGRTQLAYLAYMPEKKRILLHCHRAAGEMAGALLLESADLGETWSEPRYMHTDANGAPDGDASNGLTYLGDGRLISASETYWFSDDYGQTWGGRTKVPKSSDGKEMYVWDPMLVDHDPATGAVVRLAETRYKEVGTYGVPGYTCQSCIRCSTDGGKTWGDELAPPEWLGCNECVLVRARNGDIVAILRQNFRGRYAQLWHDNYCGMAVSISQDNGRTWSPRQVLFDWGRMHSSPVLMPNGDIVVTYLVRRGYPNTPDGSRPQYGIEAVVSHDNGRTWDLDHRYLLYIWTGAISSRDPYMDMSTGCNTSTVVLPDSSLLTVAGVGPRLDPTRRDTTPRDDILISWRLNPKAVSRTRRIAAAPDDSDLRNKLDINRFITASKPAAKRNIALLSEGAKVTSSPGLRDYYGPGPISPEFLLHDPYTYAAITRFAELPAWIEVRWDKANRIDQIDIYPGDIGKADTPETERVPLDYRLQYEQDGTWVDVVPPVTNAPRLSDHLKTNPRRDEFKYEHTFSPVKTKAVRLTMTRSSDPNTPNTIIRMFEVYEAK